MEELERHVSNGIIRLVFDLLLETLGDDGVTEACRLAGETRPLEELRDDVAWSNYDQFRRLTEAASTVLGSDDALHGVGFIKSFAIDLPSAAEMLQLLGSPSALLAQVAAGHNSVMPIMENTAEQVGPTEWLTRQRTRPGFEPFSACCGVTVGLAPLAVRVFGYEEVTAVEETCQLRGDEWCTIRLSWEELDEKTRRLVTLEQRATMLEQKLETFQTTVADMVVADDLESTLEQVVLAASHAVRATGFVLAIEELPGVSRRVYSRGLDEDRAEDIAASLLAGEERDDLAYVVDIVSNRRHYGRLAAYDPAAVMLLEFSTLRAYARLAATALDSATELEDARHEAAISLEDARQEAARASALLSLAGALAAISTTEEMATILSRTVPAVVGADRCVVAVADRERDVVRFAAAHGFSTKADADMIGFELPALDLMPTTILYLDQDTAADYAESFGLPRGWPSWSAAVVVVPVLVDGRAEAWLFADVADDAARLAPGPDLEARLLGLAAQASTALYNARLLEMVSHQALHDALTGLPNRALIMDRAEQLLARSRRDHAPVGALFIDLDGFKEINDTLGHAAGDELLRAVAIRLSATVRKSDMLARLGGDEFVVLVDGLTMDVGPELLAERILDVLREPFQLEGREHPLTITTSIGIAIAVGETTASDLLRDADVALYQAKAAGKSQAILFAPAMQTAARDDVELEMDVHAAFDLGQYLLVYQPTFDLRSGGITGDEVLLRWSRPARGGAQPNDFIPLLEETGLIMELGSWVLEEACRQTAIWHGVGHTIDISVNVAARQLESDRLLTDVSSAPTLTGLAATSLTRATRRSPTSGSPPWTP